MEKNSTYPIAATDTHYQQMGLTKLEYFAGMAMQGLLANSDAVTCDDDKLVA